MGCSLIVVLGCGGRSGLVPSSTHGTGAGASGQSADSSDGGGRGSSRSAESTTGNATSTEPGRGGSSGTGGIGAGLGSSMPPAAAGGSTSAAGRSQGGEPGTGGEPLTPGGGAGVDLPAGCEAVSFYSSNNCVLNVACGANEAAISCVPNTWGTDVTCYCDASQQEYLLNNVPVSSACSFVARFCPGPETPVCQIAHSSETSCRVDRECAASVGGVTLLVRGTGGPVCSRASTSVDWTCSCLFGTQWMTFDYPADATAEHVCPAAADVCSSGALEGEDDRECTLESRTLTPNSCDAYFECTRSGNVGDTRVQVQESVSMRCTSPLEGQWQCSCIGGEPFEMSGEDAWAVCSDAADRCLEQIAG